MIELIGDEFCVVMNSTHPWVGFCRTIHSGTCLLDFIDAPLVAETLIATRRYRVLEKHELKQSLRAEVCSSLLAAELVQIKYWKKSGLENMRVGDVIFNFWD